MIKYLVVSLTFILMLGTAAELSAHAFLDTATPKVGAVVTTAPTEIRIKFTQNVEGAFAHIQVVGSGGKPIEMGDPAIDPKDPTALIAAVKSSLEPGRYDVEWDVVSVDTHRTNGHYPFTYKP